MEAIIFCVILYYAVKTAHERTKAAFKSSREAYAGRAAKAHPGMTRGQQVRSALRHDAGFAAAQLRHGFPSARHGFAQGWHEARTAHAQASAGREKAKTEHAESLAGLIEEIRQYRERQAAAAERIRASAADGASGGSDEGTPEGSTSPDPGTVIQGTAEDVPGETGTRPRLCWSCFARDGDEHAAWCATREPVWPDDTDGPTYSWGLADAAIHWPVANREQAERQAQAASRDGRTHVVLEYPPGGGQGRIAAAFRDGEPSERLPDDDRDAPLPGEDGYVSTGSAVPDCWLCGLPVDGAELGASAHQRCLDVNDRDMEQTEVVDSRPLEEVERDLREQDRCPYQDKPNDPNGAAIYCGQPIVDSGADEPDEFCPQHQAEAENDYDRAAEEVHRRTRELLANEPDSTATTGGTQMSDVTYDGVVRAMNSAVEAAEDHGATARTAHMQAANVADQMQALDVDSATLGAMADHLDALDAAAKSQQQVLDTARNVHETLQRGHAQLAEAHKDAVVEAADKAFYQD